MSAKQVDLAIVGCGYMGGNGVLAFAEAQKKLGELGITLHLVLVVEPTSENFAHLVAHCEKAKLPFTPARFRRWEDALAFLGRNENHLPLVVFDASPPNAHFSHYALAAAYLSGGTNGRRIFYLGEKPLFIDPFQVDAAEKLGAPLACDLIESENPVFKLLQGYVEREKPKILQMYFWRAGSSGLKKTIRADRAGVQGGAILDKAPHDLSISINLLGTTGVSGSVAESTIHLFIASPEYLESEWKTPSLIRANGKTATCAGEDLARRDEFLADGLSSISVDWTVAGSDEPIKAKYLFSWVGVGTEAVEEEFKQKFADLGYDYADFLLEATLPGPWKDKHPLAQAGPDQDHQVYEVRVEELRLGLLLCEDRVIVASFLGKTGAKRFACVHWPDRKPENINEDAFEGGQKAAELGDVFVSAVQAFLEAREPRFVGRETAFETHRVLLKAQEQAIRTASRDFELLSQRAAEAAQRKIKKYSPGI